jgi:hypothetical protein
MNRIYEIRSAYTTPDNSCRALEIEKRAAIAIAHDIATLVGEIERLHSEVLKRDGEISYLLGKLASAS